MSLAPRLDRLDKNYLINGAFDFYQRNGATVATNTAPTSLYVGPDRWRLMFTGTFTGTPQVIRSGLVPDYTVRNSNRWNFQRNASTGILTYEQRVEAINCHELFQAGKMSLSFSINSTVAPVGTEVRMYIYSANSNNDFSSVTLQSSKITAVPTANTWQKLTFENITTTAAMLNGIAVRIEIAYPSGTDASAQYVLLTKAMLNCGSDASDFNRFGRNIVEEFQMCQRYYEKSYDQDTAPGSITSIGVVGGLSVGTGVGNVSIQVYFKIPKRLSAFTPVVYNPLTGATGSMDRNTTSIASTVDIQGTNSMRIYNTVSTADQNIHFGHYTVEAEL